MYDSATARLYAIYTINKNVFIEASIPYIPVIEERIKLISTLLPIIKTEVVTLYEKIPPWVQTTLEKV